MIGIPMMTKRISLILFFFLFPAISFGQTTESIDPVLDNLSSEYAECTAFFSIAYIAAAKKDDKEALAKRLGELQETSLKITIMLVAQGRDVEMTEKVTRSRIEMYDREMKKEIGNNLANFSILMNKYLSNCVEAVQSPEEWLENRGIQRR